jgi:1-pyrroline-5-carboxylate dehydrogenase
MANGIFNVPAPYNEPVMNYAPGSPERAELQRMLDKLSKKVIDIPARINGRKVRTGKLADAVMPHDHGHVLGRWPRQVAQVR